jgi:hypothetical protein
MKKSRLVSVIFANVLFMCIQIAWPQALESNRDSDPRLDRAKPMAYLILEHIGSRDPIRSGEGTTGLFLRLHNNSRLPLVVAVLKNKNTSVPALLDEVMPNPKPVLGAGVPWMPSPGFPNTSGWDDLQAYPNENQQAVRAAEVDAQRQAMTSRKGRVVRPSGYGWELAPILTVVPAGETLLFSLPVTHVSPEWHIQIPFRLGLASDGRERPPYSYLSLFWDDLPEDFRSTHTVH